MESQRQARQAFGRVAGVAVAVSLVLVAGCGSDQDEPTNGPVGTTGAAGAAAQAGAATDAEGCAGQWNGASAPQDQSAGELQYYAPAEATVTTYPAPALPDLQPPLGVRRGACVVFVRPPSKDSVGLIFLREVDVVPTDPAAEPVFADYTGLFSGVGQPQAIEFPEPNATVQRDLRVELEAPSATDSTTAASDAQDECEPIVITPNTDDVIANLTVQGISCEDAAAVLRPWAEGGYPGDGPSGFTCEDAGRPPSPEGGGTGLRCAMEDQVITFGGAEGE